MGGWPPKTESPGGPESILFFKLITKLKSDEWVETFFKKGTGKQENYLETDELRDKLIYDYAVESYQLAQKTMGKVRTNLIAHMFFYASFCSVFLMAYTAIISFLDIWSSTTNGLIFLILFVFGYIEVKVFRKYIKQLC